MTATKRSILSFVSKRYFQARPAKVPFPPPYTIKTKFDHSHTEPFKNWELSVTLSGDNYEKHNALYKHYKEGEYFVTKSPTDFEKFYGGYFGEYWPAHFGGGYHKFLRRRSTESGIYNHKHPWRNFIRQQLDNRGIHWDFPRGQDYHIIVRWVLTLYVIVFLGKQYSNWSAHRKGLQPLVPDAEYPIRFNLPFYVYIIHQQQAPNLE